MTALDPALCARRIAEARDRATPHPMEQFPSSDEKLLTDLADQLEAALAEIERLRAALTSRVMP